MDRLIYINIALLVVFFVGFGIWYAFKPDGPDPSEPFVKLKTYADKHGPAKAVDFLGKSQFQSVIQACRRTECIQDKYNGNRGAGLLRPQPPRKTPVRPTGMNAAHPQPFARSWKKLWVIWRPVMSLHNCDARVLFDSGSNALESMIL